MKDSDKVQSGIKLAVGEIFRAMAEGIVVVNEDGSIDLANGSAEAMFGYQKNEMSGLQLNDLIPGRFHKVHSQYHKEFHEQPTPRRMGVGRDLKAVRKDGSEFPVEIGLSPFNVQGKKQVIAFVTDITTRKEAEEALRQSEEQLIIYAAELEKKVTERTQELNESIQELEKEVVERKKAQEETKRALDREIELSDLKSRFVSIASHEFKTPLSTILSSNSLIEQYVLKQDLEKIDKHTKRIKTSVGHLTSVLNDLLSLGRLEEGKIEAIKSDFDVRKFLHETIEELEGVLKNGQIIKLASAVPDVKLHSDEKILRNILFNLVSNASKYSDADKSITIGCQVNSSTLVFSIKDEGIGIPSADQKHLFTQFFRAGNVSNVPGTGLGLSIVGRYVDLIGGTIRFESEEKKGTIFEISVPTE